MASRREKLIEATLKNQQEIRQAGLTRRELLKMGLLSAGGLLVAKSGLSLRALAGTGNCGPSFDPMAPCVSNPTTPFKNLLPIPSAAQSCTVADLSMAPSDWPTNTPVSTIPTDPEWQLHKGIRLSSSTNPATNGRCYRQVLQETTQKNWDPEGNQLGGTDTAWVFDGQFPGSTFLARHKEPVMIRRYNCLPQGYAFGNTPIPGGFGKAWPSTHLHNFHTADQSDGGPWELRQANMGNGQKDGSGELTFGMFGPGDYHDYHYTMAWAGFTSGMGGGWGDVNEAMNTLWYHDHCRDFTSQNVYKGMAGMFWIFDDNDTGNEQEGLRFPSGSGQSSGLGAKTTGYGKYDIPLVLSDRMFNPGGESVFPLFNLDGVIGDKYTVNGVLQPRFEVEPRRYRFRVLDIGPSRLYRLAIVGGTKSGAILTGPIPNAFCMITNQGNLIEYPVITDRFNICPAERFDVLVDFKRLQDWIRTQAPQGTDSLFLVNLMEQTDGRGPSYKDMKVPGLVMRFDLKSSVSETDQSFDYFQRADGSVGTLVTSATGAKAWVNDRFAKMPDNTTWKKLLPLPSLPSAADLSKLQVNTFLFDRKNGNWTVNGRIFDDTPFNSDPNIKPPKNGEPQIWVIKASGNWSHPVHIHFEEGQVVTYNGVAASNITSKGPFDDKGRLFSGRRDVYCVGPNDEMRVYIRFRDFCDGKSRYPMHCHNVVHEDHAMMMRYDI